MKGVITALIVPYHSDGSVNESGLRQVVRHNMDVCGVDGLYVNGSTGENFLISKDEKKEIFAIVKDEVKDQVPLIAQVGSINLYEAVELGKYATDLGYDCLSAVTPYYYPFSFEETKYYYDSITDAGDKPMLVYSIPALTGVHLSLSQFEQLFENEKIIGIKFTAADFYLLERIRRRFPEKRLLAGFDEMLLSAAVLGVDGAIGSTFNVNGKRAKEILRLVQEGQVEEARHLQHVTNDLIEKILDLGLYQTLKEIMKVKGLDAGECRKPLQPFDPARKREVKELVGEFSL